MTKKTAPKHVHEYKKGNSSISICSCGRFKHNEPFEAIEEVTAKHMPNWTPLRRYHLCAEYMNDQTEKNWEKLCREIRGDSYEKLIEALQIALQSLEDYGSGNPEWENNLKADIATIKEAIASVEKGE